SFSEGIFSPSAEAIVYVLANVTPQEFHSEVFKAFTEAPLSVTQRQIDDFLATLKTAGIPHAAAAERAVAEETVRHCARCHQNYLEKHNGRIACSILHDDPQPLPGPDFEPVVYIIPCCPSATDGNPYHFIGRHTTVAKAVAYNTSNVRECFPGCSG
ncbi:hypothetical protein B0H13DRAFT_1565548, partial [Mycena leptocephala]